MSECRVYSDPPWSVVVTHENEHPERVEQITVRCAQPGCGGVFKWIANQYYGGTSYNGSPMVLTRGNGNVIANFGVCDCTRRQFTLQNGKVPPWLTREEQVAWHLTT